MFGSLCTWHQLKARYIGTNITGTGLKLDKMASLQNITLYCVPLKYCNSLCSIDKYEIGVKLNFLDPGGYLGNFKPNHRVKLCSSTVCPTTGTENRPCNQYSDTL